MPEIIPSGPKCPGCAERPMATSMRVDNFPNGMLVAFVHCMHCGHVFSAFMCGMAQPKMHEPTPGGKPRLVS